MIQVATLACASSRTPPVASPATTAGSTADELPDGRGKTIVLASCTGCHGLREVTKFRGFYNRAQWRDIVVTMVEYGAPVRTQDVEVLADYLSETLGRR
jgi:cytochrome c5